MLIKNMCAPRIHNYRALLNCVPVCSRLPSPYITSQFTESNRIQRMWKTLLSLALAYIRRPAPPNRAAIEKKEKGKCKKSCKLF